jgi:DNA-binding response OmpR family regulator
VIAMLHPQMGEERQLDLFRRGVEDCLVVPQNSELLKQRLGVLSRRFGVVEAAPETITAEGLLVDLRARKVVVNDAVVALTRKEFDLLNMLLRKRGIVAYTTHLYHSVWGYGESSPVDSHTVKVHISSLRSKLGPALGRKIVNLPGLGYRFDD